MRRLAFVLAATVGLSACHSHHHAAAGKATLAAAVQRVNAVCAAAGSPPGPPPGNPAGATAADLPAWSAYLSTSVPRLEATVQKLRDAVPTAQRTPEISHLWARFDQVDADGHVAEDTAGRTDVVGFRRAAQALGHDAALADEDARALGFTACGGG